MRKSLKVFRGLWVTMIVGLVIGGMMSCSPYCLDCKDYRIDGQWTEICQEIECNY